MSLLHPPAPPTATGDSNREAQRDHAPVAFCRPRLYNTCSNSSGSRERTDIGVSVDLAKVDLIRERIRCTYDEARKALEATGGDVVSALALLEKKRPTSEPPDTTALAAELVDDVVRILEAGRIRAVRLRLGDRVVKEIPVEVTAVGAIVLGALVVLASKFAIELVSDRASE